MTRSETLGVIASGAFGPTILVLYLLRILTADLAFAVIGFSFAVALVPGLIENRRKRIGWSKRSCILTGNNLYAFTAIFLTLGLPITAFSEFVSAAMWTVLLVQAYLYAKPLAPRAPVEAKEPCTDPECGCDGTAPPTGPVCIEEDPEMCKPSKVYEAPDENAGRMLQRGTLIVEVFDAHYPEMEAKATAVIKAALESMK